MSLIRRAGRRALKLVGRGPHQAPPVLTSNAMLAPGNQWYAPALAGASTFASAAVDPATVRQALDVLQRLTPDAYADYVSAFYRAGLERHGDRWRYADVNTALLALASGLRPQSYLEIGVRRGRSLAMVSSVCPACDIVA